MGLVGGLVGIFSVWLKGECNDSVWDSDMMEREL